MRDQNKKIKNYERIKDQINNKFIDHGPNQKFFWHMCYKL